MAQLVLEKRVIERNSYQSTMQSIIDYDNSLKNDDYNVFSKKSFGTGFDVIILIFKNIDGSYYCQVADTANNELAPHRCELSQDSELVETYHGTIDSLKRDLLNKWRFDISEYNL